MYKTLVIGLLAAFVLSAAASPTFAQVSFPLADKTCSWTSDNVYLPRMVDSFKLVEGKLMAYHNYSKLFEHSTATVVVRGMISDEAPHLVEQVGMAYKYTTDGSLKITLTPQSEGVIKVELSTRNNSRATASGNCSPTVK